MDTQRYAIIDGGAVVDIISPVKGFTLAECFPVEVAGKAVECDEDVQQGWVYDGQLFTPPPPPAPPTLEEQQAAFTAAIQARLDTFAQGRNYDNALACASYATSTNPRFAAEGQYMVEARDATWAKGYEILDAVLSGERTMPTMEEVMAELPPLVWPDDATAGKGGA